MYRENVPISSLTTMRIGGSARWVRDITSPSQIADSYAFARAENVPVFILGGGSNVFGRDEGYDGLILINKLRGIEIIREVAGDIILKGYGGEILDDFISFSTKRGYSGIEAMSGVPGTLGAAPVQNVGAYGQEISQVLDYVEAYDTRTGRIVKIGIEDMQIGYRRSIFNYGRDAGRYFIISVIVKLKKGHLTPPFYTSLQRYVDEHSVTDFSPASIRDMVKIIRDQKLPDPKYIPSSGSFFKNVNIPDSEVDKARADGFEVWKENGRNVINSGWLIESAGLKGKEFYGMRVSDKAALILINDSAKSYADLAKAREHIIDVVKEKYGFTLEQEPVEIK